MGPTDEAVTEQTETKDSGDLVSGAWEDVAVFAYTRLLNISRRFGDRRLSLRALVREARKGLDEIHEASTVEPDVASRLRGILLDGRE